MIKLCADAVGVSCRIPGVSIDDQRLVSVVCNEAFDGSEATDLCRLCGHLWHEHDWEVGCCRPACSCLLYDDEISSSTIVARGGQ